MRIHLIIQSLAGGGAEKGFVNLVNELSSEHHQLTVHCQTLAFERLPEIRQQVSLSSYVAGRTLFFGKKSRRLYTPHSHYITQILSPSIFRRTFPFGFHDAEILFMDGMIWKAIVGAPGNPQRILRFANVLDQYTGAHEYLLPGLRIKHHDLYSAADAIVFPSRLSLESFVAVVGSSDKLYQIYNVNRREELVEQAKQPLPITKSGLTLCVSGRLVPQKGYVRLFQICRRLLDDGFRFKLWILGRGAQEAELKAQEAALGLQDTVVFLGYQSNPYPYVAAADLYVSAAYFEGLSNSAKEALLLGLPCVVADCSGMKEIFGENSEYGLVTQPDDESLYQGIYRMLSEPGLRDHYRQMAPKRWDYFSPARSLAQYEALFEGRDPR